MPTPSAIPEVQSDESRARIAALNAEPVIKPGAFAFNPPRTRDPHAPAEQDRTRFEFPSQEDPKRTSQGDPSVLPDGVNINDTLVWNGTAWVVLSAPATEGNFVLSVIEGAIGWVTPPLPEGYAEQAITLCISGTNTPGTILFKADPPPGP